VEGYGVKGVLDRLRGGDSHFIAAFIFRVAAMAADVMIDHLVTLDETI
jgi:hypothetical protein